MLTINGDPYRQFYILGRECSYFNILYNMQKGLYKIINYVQTILNNHGNESVFINVFKKCVTFLVVSLL